jgi:sirohydrochlorin cobaltochelatase
MEEEMTRRALILFAHGARDPRWAAPFERLQAIVQAQQPDVAVALAFLELMTPSLPDTVAHLVQGGCAEVTVVPVFLGQSGHVLRDVPPLVEGLRGKYPEVTVKLTGAVGENADVLNAIARYCVDALAKP